MAERKRDHMTEAQRVKGFKALVESGKSGGYFIEDVDGNFRTWQDMSLEGKLDHIARDAAYYNVPFRAFAEEVRKVFSTYPPMDLEESALRTVLRSAVELHGLAMLIPDDGRTEGTPLIEAFREQLGKKSLDDLRAVGSEKQPGQTHTQTRGRKM